MGILGLSRLIADLAPGSIKEMELASYFGRRIAIDASMSIYQFLIAIRSQNQMMTNDSGDSTSHLVGLFYRTCKLLEVGVKPVYVFDGRAPQLKASELEKRKERRADAEAKLSQAVTVEDVNKFSKRLVRVTRHHNDECKRLLRLMGLPVIESPGEAEAQCAQLCKEGLVYAVATEDMDGLTFGAPRLVRSLSVGSADKTKEFTFDKVLSGLDISYAQFIDLCILMGCDYCGSIRGIGGKKGIDLIKKYCSIEEILRKKYNVTEFVDEVEVNYVEKQSNSTSDADVPKEGAKKAESQEKADEEVEDEAKDVKEKVDTKEKKKTPVEEVERLEAKSVENSEDEGEEVMVQLKSASEAEDEDDDIEKEDEEEDNEDAEEEEDEEEKKVKKKNGKANNGKAKQKVEKRIVPENWLFKGARKLFLEPNVIRDTKEADLKQKEIDEEGLVEFLCVENGFSEDRIRAAVKRVKLAKGKCSQTRIDTFFKTMPSTNANGNGKGVTPKRQATKSAAGSKAKRGRRPK